MLAVDRSDASRREPPAGTPLKAALNSLMAVTARIFALPRLLKLAAIHRAYSKTAAQRDAANSKLHTSFTRIGLTRAASLRHR